MVLLELSVDDVMRGFLKNLILLKYFTNLILLNFDSILFDFILNEFYSLERKKSYQGSFTCTVS